MDDRATKAVAWLRRLARTVRRTKGHRPTHRDAANLETCARIITQLLEHSMNVSAIALAAVQANANLTTKVTDLTNQLANVPQQPPADRVLTDQNVADLKALATAVGVDENGQQLPPVDPAITSA